MAIHFDREEVKRWTELDNNYKINEKMQLGKGAYGIVFQGYSLKKDTLVAIKTIKSNSLSER
jgi:serine/threonine protein kinase